jgi:hypothetical protein
VKRDDSQGPVRILYAYVAAVCLVSVAFALYDAPLFMRARQRAENATNWKKNATEAFENQGPQPAGTEEERNRITPAEKALARAENESAGADDDYHVQRAYAILIGGILLAHILLLGIVMRRQRPVTTPPSN